MSLKDELKPITGKKRRYLLMRVAEVESDTARKMCNIQLGTFRGWWTRATSNETFLSLNRRVEEFTVDYKQEAIQMLRRDNQLSAVMLEEQIINKMKEEVESGEYNLIRTNLARDVYTKLIGELDFKPAVNATVTWDQRIQNLFTESAPVLAISTPDVVTDAMLEEESEPEIIEADISLQSEHPEVTPEAESEQANLQATQAS